MGSVEMSTKEGLMPPGFLHLLLGVLPQFLLLGVVPLIFFQSVKLCLTNFWESAVVSLILAVSAFWLFRYRLALRCDTSHIPPAQPMKTAKMRAMMQIGDPLVDNLIIKSKAMGH